MPAPLDIRRRQVRFRCWHRGTREMDLLLGRFADEHLADLTEEGLGQLEALLDAPDPQLYAWYSGREPVPATYDTFVMRLFKNFRFTPPQP